MDSIEPRKEHEMSHIVPSVLTSIAMTAHQQYKDLKLQNLVVSF